ncbi:methionyl-tRNA synthetase [Vibrio maritimus]|uniref:Methionyl-tRNA synthetase n=1 Tax=Vibrio maritimus TaxID=990268 RepID=A0A090TU96_9VIBR|nr:methionyl-tRNA synthetase [Vibrio maritimus]
MPGLAARTEAFLNETLTWEGIATPLTGHEITKFKALFNRIDPKKVEAMIEASKEDAAAEVAAKEKAEAEKNKASQTELDKDPIADEIEFDDFAKVDMRIARIILVKKCQKRTSYLNSS